MSLARFEYLGQKDLKNPKAKKSKHENTQNQTNTRNN